MGDLWATHRHHERVLCCGETQLDEGALRVYFKILRDNLDSVLRTVSTLWVPRSINFNLVVLLLLL